MEIDTPIDAKNFEEPNFRSRNGQLYLVRCFMCDRDYGRENWAPAVATGKCAWCGWYEGKKYPEISHYSSKKLRKSRKTRKTPANAEVNK